MQITQINILTEEYLDKCSPNAIFAWGIGYIEHPWFNDERYKGDLQEDGKTTLVKWVATKGTISDWAIYHSLDGNFSELTNEERLNLDLTSIYKGGAKLHDEKKIKEWVPCTEEVFKLYRQ